MDIQTAEANAQRGSFANLTDGTGVSSGSIRQKTGVSNKMINNSMAGACTSLPGYFMGLSGNCIAKCNTNLIYLFGFPPLWIGSSTRVNDMAYDSFLRVKLSKEEYNRIRAVSKEKGFGSVSAFMRFVLGCQDMRGSDRLKAKKE